MTHFADSLVIRLGDFYLLSLLLLALALGVAAFLRQPAHRLAIVKATLVALAILATLCALPRWSVVHLVAANKIQPPPTQLHVAQPATIEPTDTVHVTAPRDSVVTQGAAVEEPSVTIKAGHTPPVTTWPLALSVTYIVGALGFAVWLCIGSLAARRLRHSATAAPDQLAALLADVATRTGVSPKLPSSFGKNRLRQIDLLISDRTEVLVALGLAHPAILLPQTFAQTAIRNPKSEIESVLAHELAHIVNRDLYWLAASRLLMTILWAQPLFWFFRHRMRLEQEALADAAAAEVTSRQDYAEQLVAWARNLGSRPRARVASAVGLWEGPSQLRQRIGLLLNERFYVLHDCSGRWRTSSFAACALLALGLSLLTLRPGQSAPADRVSSRTSTDAEKVAAAKTFPTGHTLHLNGVKSDWIIQAASESKQRCFVDLETRREAGWPTDLPLVAEDSMANEQVLKWARERGFDLMGFKYQPPGYPESLYCLQPIDMKAWMISPDEQRNLPQSMTGKIPYPLNNPVDKLMPGPHSYEGPDKSTLGGTAFLFITREGTPGLLRMTAQVTDTNVRRGVPGTPDDQFSTVGFYRGARISFAFIVSPEAEPKHDQPAPSDEEKSDRKSANDATSNTTDAESQIVSVHCVDINGKPVAGAEIHVFQHDGQKNGRYVDFAGLSSDENGRAALSKALVDKENGTYDRWIYARVPGKFVGVARSAKWKHHPRVNPEGRVVMQPSRSVEGLISVPPGFSPQDVTVQVRTMNVTTGAGEWDYQSFPREDSFPGIDTALPEIFERRFNADGYVQFDDMPAQGQLYLVTRGKGLAEGQWRNDKDTFEKPFRITIEKEGRLSGRVLLPDGQPAAGMSVGARIMDNAMYLTTFYGKTDSNGEFEIDGLPDNALALSITDQNENWVFRPMEDIAVQAGKSVNRTLTMESGVLVSGRVMDQDGNPVEGASFSAITDTNNGAGLDHASTDAKGRYQFRLPAGGASLYFDALPDGFAYPEPQIVKKLDIKGGQTPVENADITLPKKAAANPQPDSTLANSDGKDAKQGSQMLRDLRAKSAPLLAKMAAEHGYGLAEGQDVARVAPPFAPIRMEWYRVANPSQAESIPRGPESMLFLWSNGKLQNRGMSFSDPANPGSSVLDLCDWLLNVKSQGVEGPESLLKKVTPGDWVVRNGVKKEALAKQLQAILQKECSIPVRLEFREVNRPVYVVSGEYGKITPPPGYEAQDVTIYTDKTVTTDEIQIYGKELVPNSGSGGGTGDFNEFLNWLGRWIEAPIVSDVKKRPKNEISWQLHGRSPFTEQMRREDHDPEVVLANITKQTGLKFTLEERPLRILFVEPVEK